MLFVIFHVGFSYCSVILSLEGLWCCLGFLKDDEVSGVLVLWV